MEVESFCKRSQPVAFHKFSRLISAAVKGEAQRLHLDPEKVNKQQLQAVKERFLAFLNGETQIVADEAFCNAVRSYYESLIFLKRSSIHSFGVRSSLQ
ncbi:hypothetical protein NQZ68_016999 [Dissostichus eleginoides]|nr:hypothetical protein NQZ68_016999 [Dissostichus eleginoides]